MTDRSRLRLVILAALVLSLPVTLIGRLWYMQALAGSQYVAELNHNTTKEIRTVAPRGLILDDEGRPLARNRSALVVTALSTAMPSSDAARTAEIARLSAVLGVPADQLAARVTLCDYHKYGAKAPQMNPGCWTGSPLQPIPLVTIDSTTAAGVKHASDVALQVLEQQEEFPGVNAQVADIRDYPAPENASAAQIIGNVGKITADDVNSAQTTAEAGLLEAEASAGGMIGQAGLEAEYDTYLQGTMGTRTVSVDPAGRPLATLSEVPPTPGDEVVTSIDARVQKIAENALVDAVEHARTVPQLANGKHVTQHADAAAAVVLDARTGHVVALANYPSYDPRVWNGGSISQQNYNRLLKEPGKPLVSQAVQGQYAPGSTFKVVTTAAAVSTPYYSLSGTYDCPTNYQNRTNFEGETGKGSISFAEAIKISCDTFFYSIGGNLWNKDGGLNAKSPTDAIINEARAWGLGTDSGIDLPIDGSGDVETRQQKIDTWKKNKARWCAEVGTEKNPLFREYDYENCHWGYLYQIGDALNTAIGQGTVTVTPVQLATVYAALGNGGTLFSPRVGKAIVGPDGRLVENVDAPSKKLAVPANVLHYEQQALSQVTTAPGGTATSAFAGFPFDRYSVSGKTGTAEVQALNPDGSQKDSTAWFASFGGPAGQPAEYAVVVMVSQGGQGGVTAAPAVREIYDGIYGLDGGANAYPHDHFTTPALAGGVPPAALPDLTPVQASSPAPQPAPAASASGTGPTSGAVGPVPALLATPPDRRIGPPGTAPR